MGIDSVFAPSIPDAGDRPEMPVTEILGAMASAEGSAIALVNAALERSTARLLSAAEGLTVESLQLLTWDALPDLRRGIYAAWESGWSAGYGHAIEEMRRSIPQALMEEATFAIFATDPGLLQAIARLLSIGLVDLRQSSVATAVDQRVLRLAGDFSEDTLNRLKSHLIASVTPQPDTGFPISRRQLLERIETTLNVSRNRAQTIARTETTNAYNTARVQGFVRSPLVEAVRFLAISDDRTTPICISRNGLVILITDQAAIAANTPALHYRCRSVLSPLLPRVNRRHAEILSDESRRIENRSLAPLMRGWNVS